MHRRLCHRFMDLCLPLFPSVRQSAANGQEWGAGVGLGSLRESRTQAPQGAEGLLGIVQELIDNVFKLQGTYSHPNVSMHLVHHCGDLVQALGNTLIDLFDVHHHRVYTSLGIQGDIQIGRSDTPNDLAHRRYRRLHLLDLRPQALTELPRVLGETAHFRGDHGETTAGLASTGGFHCGVESQHMRIIGDRLNVGQEGEDPVHLLDHIVNLVRRLDALLTDVDD